MISVRFAHTGDQDRLVTFVHDHWSSTHVFSTRPEVFRWQHLDHSGRLNMVMAEDTEAPGRPVLGILGFIPMGRFSTELGDSDVMLAIWKVREDVAPPGLGLRLLKFLQAELSPRLVAAIGISTMVRRLYKVLGYEIGGLLHSAIFNPDRRNELRIAQGVPESAFGSPAPVVESQLELRRLDEAAPIDVRAAVDRVAATVLPVKNWEYLVNRFLRHPWYRYELRSVHRGGELVAVVVWRAVSAHGATLLRIVDIVGEIDWLSHASEVLIPEVIRSEAEYIDVVQWGIDAAPLAEGGFVTSKFHESMVLPNYFEPFEARNVDIEFAFKVTDGDVRPVRLFRADSDQDRPNLVAER